MAERLQSRPSLVDSQDDFEERVTEVAGEIRRYLERSPMAADTLDGIRRWWLQLLRIEEAQAIVETALEVLMKEGLISAETSEHGETVYRRTPKDEERDSDG